jgi:Domain of unknown function (DUF4118)
LTRAGPVAGAALHCSIGKHGFTIEKSRQSLAGQSLWRLFSDMLLRVEWIEIGNGMTSERTALAKFVANSIGAAGGLLVGSITFGMGAPWWSLPLCAALGVVIGRLLPNGNSDADAPAPAVSVLRICRLLPLWDRIAMSALLVVSATAVYIGFKNLDIVTAFYLYLLPIVFAQLLFGTRCGFVAGFVSLVSIYYFVIPPKNSFAVQSLREAGLICAFALLALITSATLAVLADIARTVRHERQPQQRADPARSFQIEPDDALSL